jgi:hypothetical protein
MHASPRLRRGLRLGLAALTLALNAAVVLVPGQAAQAQSAGQGGGCGPADYPVAGGWFYTEEAWIGGYGSCAGYMVLDDDKGAFWTEFRRYGGVDVLGYPVSQPYHYPLDGNRGLWYQAFERGILQWHPETGRAEMANVFRQFSDNGLDDDLAELGIPRPQQTVAQPGSNDEIVERMSWLAEPQFVSRFFYDPVPYHSSEPGRPGQSAFPTQDDAWSFFGYPETSAQRLVLGRNQEYYPLTHKFYAQRFNKAGLELFVQGGSVALDPTIVPGDGAPGCVALTATGLLARRLGIDKLIPAAKLTPQPEDLVLNPVPRVATYVPDVASGETAVTFQVSGTGFGPNEPITINLTNPQPAQTLTLQTGPVVPTIGQSPLTPVTANARTFTDGSFTVVMTAQVATYTLTVTGGKSNLVASHPVNLTNPNLTNPRGCTPVGLPIWN